MHDDTDDETGSFADEAAKLFGVFAELGRGLGDQVGHGSECRFCPVCQLINLVRDASPEVKEHLTAASASLLQALDQLFNPVQTDEDDAESD
jgi:hypothetical protein